MGKTLSMGLMYAFLLTFTANAEIVCALGSGPSSYNANADQRPTPDVMQLAGRVNAALARTCSPKCPEIAVFRNETAANAMLVVTTEQAKLVYAPKFFATVYDNYGDGAIIAIIAHEYGHALAETYPAKWMKGGWSPELRADAWAGCALARNDVNSNNLREALTALSKYPSSAHPAWTVRLPAVRLGYIHCGQDGATFDSVSSGRTGK
jgi:hypothetical protein